MSIFIFEVVNILLLCVSVSLQTLCMFKSRTFGTGVCVLLLLLLSLLFLLLLLVWAQILWSVYSLFYSLLLICLNLTSD